MSTLVRTPPSAPVESQLLAGLHLALGAFSKDLTAELVALVHAQLGATKPSRKTVEKAVVESVPVLLEKAFVHEFPVRQGACAGAACVPLSRAVGSRASGHGWQRLEGAHASDGRAQGSRECRRG